jgi:cytoskeletal protein CcmA (bactofilin family)
MGRFSKFRAPKITTVIGRDTELHGDVKFHGGLHVDGVIIGNVTGGTDERCTLILSESGSIEGDVRVAHVILNGTISGDVYVSERAELASQARVAGTLYYHLLEMSIGAEVNGQLVHMEEEETRMLSYDGAADTAEEALAPDADAEQEPESGPQPVEEADSEVNRERSGGIQ